MTAELIERMLNVAVSTIRGDKAIRSVTIEGGFEVSLDACVNTYGVLTEHIEIYRIPRGDSRGRVAIRHLATATGVYLAAVTLSRGIANGLV